MQWRWIAWTARVTLVSIILAGVTQPAPGQGQNVRVVGQLGGYCRAVEVVGNVAYIGDGASLTILNVSNPSSPILIGRIILRDEVKSVFVSGGLAYVADFSLEIVDVTDPSHPRLLSTFNTSDAAYDVYVANNLAYIADRYSGLQIIDVANPSLPVRRGFYNTAGESYGIAVSGNLAYIADYGGGLQIINVSDPTRPTRQGFIVTRGYARDVAVSGGFAYVAYNNAYPGGGLEVLNVSNPTSPTTVGFCGLPDFNPAVAVSGTLAYLAGGSGGLQIVDVSNPSSPTLRGSYGAGGYAQAIHVSGSRAYVGDDLKDLQIVNVSNPSAPTLEGSYSTPGDAYGVCVLGNIAYIADRNIGLFTVDVSDPLKPRLLGCCKTPDVKWDISVANGIACLAAASSGLQVISVANPSSPTLRSTYPTQGTAHGVHKVGPLAYVACEQGGGGNLMVVDVSNPSSPTLRGSVALPDDAKDVWVSEGFAYVAADWRGLLVVDVTNPTTPVLRGSYTRPNPRSAAGVHVSGNLAYLAEFSGNLQIIDVGNPSQPMLRGTCTPSYTQAVYASGHYVYLSGSLQVFDVNDPLQPVLRGVSMKPSQPLGICVSNGLAYVASWQEGLWILQYIGDAPRIEAATLSDVDGDGLIEAGDQLVLTLDRSVVVATSALRASHFYLAVQGDSLGGTGFRVGVNPYNSRQIILTAGQGVRLKATGNFSTGTLTSGSPSGIDFATSIPFGAIQSLDGISAIDGGVPGVDDFGVDVQFSMVGQSGAIPPSGGAVSVVVSPDAAYRRHQLTVPAGALATTTTFTLRPPVENRGVTNAFQIESSNPAVQFAVPATVKIEYHEGDIDWERGQLESEMCVHQLVESPVGAFQYVPVAGRQTLDTTLQRAYVEVTSLNPQQSLGTVGIFAGLPIETVDERTIVIKPGGGGIVRDAPPTLKAGPLGAYTSHKIEFPNHTTAATTDPQRLVVKMRTATLAERYSQPGGCSFPAASGAIFTVTVTNGSGQPVALASPVHVTVQFKNRPDLRQGDVLHFDGRPALAASSMRLVRDRWEGDLVDFVFVNAPLQTVNTAQGTVTVQNLTGLTGADGCGTFGAVALEGVTPTDRWNLYH